MERCIAEHDAYRVAVFCKDVLYDWMKGAACLACRVEEFDYSDRRIDISKDGRVGLD